jgi:hypothetical protein
MCHPIRATGVALAVLFALGGSPRTFARVPAAPGTPVNLDAEFIRNTVETLAGKVEAEYFDPAMAARISSRLREALAQGQYAKAPDLDALATLVSSDMYAVAKDRHLSLALVRPQPTRPVPGPNPPQETREQRSKRENFGFQKIEILPGNIGYLRVTAFYRPEETGETIAEAMAFLSHADALILDFRDHGGGSTPTVALFTSYFLDSPDSPLFSVSPRPPEPPREYRTEPATLKNRNGSRPTFLLTSPRTCSGGEGVAYLLQERHRALVIGEGTWGGANQIPNPRPIGEGLQAFIPNGHMGTSLTGKNWEGVGIIPDIPARADQALRVAQGLALQALLRSAAEGAGRDILKKELAQLDPPPAAEPAAH